MGVLRFGSATDLIGMLIEDLLRITILGLWTTSVVSYLQGDQMFYAAGTAQLTAR
jgi:hypothetical protein